jgi:multisubunit Na+/H+ antiporter MnhC subunit
VVGDILRAGASALIVVLIMIFGSLVLWIGVPVGWLWIGSQIQGSTGNVGTAIGAMFLGVLVSVVILAMGLGWLNRRYMELRRARGLQDTASPLERVMVITAAIAVVGFTVWFLGVAGPGPTLAPK